MEVQLETYTIESRSIVPRPVSSVYKHFINNHNTENISSKVDVMVMTKEMDPVNLRLKEAFHIRKPKNSKLTTAKNVAN